MVVTREEIDPFTAERIIDAAATGGTVDGFEDLVQLLSDLHEPLAESEPTGSLPPAAVVAPVGAASISGLTRRVAVGAAVVVLTLGGVAAAVSGTPRLFDPIFGSASSENSQPDSSDGDGNAPDQDTGSSAAADSEFSVVAGDLPAAEGADDDESEPGSVDASDGLSEEELVTLCIEASTHGEYVSAVARDRVDESVPHGERVSEAAHTDCGKTDDADEDPEDEMSEADSVDTSDGLSEAELETLCIEASTHGEYVSAVAHDRVDESVPHGERVSEAAHTNCGKTDDDGGGEPALASQDSEADDDDDDDHASSGRGRGEAKGRQQDDD